MENIYKKILNEEVDKYVDELNINSPVEVKKVLTELFSMTPGKLMNSIGSVEVDNNKGLDDSNWDYFLDTIRQACHENSQIWDVAMANVKLRMLCYKYFSREDFMPLAELPQTIRVEIKTYFTALQNYVDFNDFTGKFFDLPTDLLYKIIRLMFATSDDFSKKAKVNNEMLKDYIGEMKKMRMRIADQISRVSNSYKTSIDLMEIKELYDSGILLEDNYINRGINEFVVKMLKHNDSSKKLEDKYNLTMLKYMFRTAESSAAYVNHINDVKSESGYEFFSSNGEQIGKRFDNEIELVKDKRFEGYVIDRESRLKEPNAKVNSVVAPWEGGSAPGQMPGDMGAEAGGVDSFGGGGTSAGGGGMDFAGGGFDEPMVDDGFAAPGEEGELPGGVDENGFKIPDEKTEGGEEEDGTPMPVDDQGIPQDFGDIEDNTDDKQKP